MVRYVDLQACRAGEFLIVAICGDCRHESALNPDDLARRFGAAFDLRPANARRLVAALVCTACGARRGRTECRQHHQAGMSATLQMMPPS